MNRSLLYCSKSRILETNSSRCPHDSFHKPRTRCCGACIAPAYNTWIRPPLIGDGLRMVTSLWRPLHCRRIALVCRVVFLPRCYIPFPISVFIPSRKGNSNFNFCYFYSAQIVFQNDWRQVDSIISWLRTRYSIYVSF